MIMGETEKATYWLRSVDKKFYEDSVGYVKTSRILEFYSALIWDYFAISPCVEM